MDALGPDYLKPFPAAGECGLEPGDERFPFVARVAYGTRRVIGDVAEPGFVGLHKNPRLSVRQEPPFFFRHKEQDREAYRHADLRGVLLLDLLIGEKARIGQTNVDLQPLVSPPESDLTLRSCPQ